MMRYADIGKPLITEKRITKQSSWSILALALPIFGQMVAEPIAILIKTAIVGHISTASLAGLSIGTTIVFTTVGLCAFLTYSITSKVAQLMGEGKRQQGFQTCVNGLWLALLLGLTISALIAIFASPLCSLLGAKGTVHAQALLYTRALCLSIPGSLLAYVCYGVFRGLFAVRIPFVIGVIGAALNTIFDIYFVYKLGWGITGPGIAISISQWFMGLFLSIVTCRWAIKAGANLKPQFKGIFHHFSFAFPLFIRGLALRIVLLTTVRAIAHLGAVVLASYHSVNSVWILTLNMLEAVGIAGQSIVGAAVGLSRAALQSGEEKLCCSTSEHALESRAQVSALTRTTARTGLKVGIVVGILLIATSGLTADFFSPNPDIRQLTMLGIITVGIFCPLQGWVWTLDGIFIGAGDTRYLAKASSIACVTYVTVMCLFITYAGKIHFGGRLISKSVHSAAIPLWDAAFLLVGFFAVYNICFMGVRAVANMLRARSGAWMDRALCECPAAA